MSQYLDLQETRVCYPQTCSIWNNDYFELKAIEKK